MASTLAAMVNGLNDLSLEDLQRLENQLLRAKNAKSSPLLQLPAELRNRIWYLAAIADLKYQRATYREAITRSPGSERPLHPPRFINTCRQARVKAMSMLFDSVMIWEEWRGNDTSFEAYMPPGQYQTLWRKLAPHQIMNLQLIRRTFRPALAVQLELVNDLVRARLWLEAEWGQYERAGIIRFAAEIEAAPMAWTTSGPHFCSDALYSMRKYAEPSCRCYQSPEVPNSVIEDLDCLCP